MRLTVLGSSASYAGPGQACAGYLVQADDTNVLLDCGNGVIANLGHVIDPLTLDAVFITHEHVDHFADLYSLQALLRYAPDGPEDPLPLYVAPGVYARIEGPLSGRARQELAEAFVRHGLEDAASVRVGDMTITPHMVDHAEPTFALRVESADTTMCYTSDTAPGQRVARAAEGAGLLLAEATLPQPFAGKAPHMTAREAGEVAASAGVRTLVMTHIWPTNDRDEMLREARGVFGGTVRMAVELDTYDIEI